MPKQRKPSDQKPLKRLRIFCEGEKTEPNYLNGYLAMLDNGARRRVIQIEPTEINTPVQLVDAAISLKKSSSSLPQDEFWVVYDRESVTKYPDALHAKARQKADRSGIKIAICNVCFEYWLLIHFIETDAPYANFDDLINNSALKAEIKKECGCDYDKSARAIFGCVKDRIPEARKRARRLNAQGMNAADPNKSEPHQINPYVGIVDLLDAIDAFT
jgi:RloB-like protein